MMTEFSSLVLCYSLPHSSFDRLGSSPTLHNLSCIDYWLSLYPYTQLPMSDGYGGWGRSVVSVELGFSEDMLGGGQGSCVGVRESSHGADLSNHNSTTPSHNVWSICHYKGREYGEHEREENVKGMATQPGTGSVNAASESVSLAVCL